MNPRTPKQAHNSTFTFCYPKGREFSPIKPLFWPPRHLIASRYQLWQAVFQLWPLWPLWQKCLPRYMAVMATNSPRLWPLWQQTAPRYGRYGNKQLPVMAVMARAAPSYGKTEPPVTQLWVPGGPEPTNQPCNVSGMRMSVHRCTGA